MSVSSSNYSSFIPDYPQAGFLSQLADIASQLGQSQYQWAQGEFQKNSALTDQAVGQYLQAANASNQLAQNNLNRYTNVFQPQEDALVRDAQTYASPSRTAFEMGKAESGAGQAADASRLNAERQLQGYGIDPSSGRYAELEMAQNAQRGASQAGAGQQAQYNTENTGRQLRGQAIQVGQQYPGQIVNALNSQVGALSGAVNAKLGNLNAGTAAMSSADPFLNTAMALKYPPLGTKGGSTSSTAGRSNSNSSNGNRGAGSGGGGGGNPYGGYGGNAGGQTGGPSASANYGAPQINGNFGSFAGIKNLDPAGDSGGGFGGDGAFNTYGQDVGSYTNYDPNGLSQFGDTSSNAMPGGGDAFNTYGQDYGGYTNFGYGNGGYDSGGGSYDYANSGGQDFGSQGDASYSTDPTAGYSSYDSGGFGGGDNSGYTGWDSGGSDYSGDYSSDYSGDMGYAGGGDVQRQPGVVDTSASGNGGQMSASGAGYSAGTAQPMAMAGVPSQALSLAGGGDPTTGGQVSQAMSPSGGQLQDDVPANLNEGEFVVPRDVAMWKGQEFFQKLIDQARKARMGASAQGKPGPRQPGPPRFNSQAMGAQ